MVPFLHTLRLACWCGKLSHLVFLPLVLDAVSEGHGWAWTFGHKAANEFDFDDRDELSPECECLEWKGREDWVVVEDVGYEHCEKSEK